MSFYANKQQAPDYRKMRAKRGRPETAEATSNIPSITQKSKRLAEKQRTKFGAQAAKTLPSQVVEHILRKETIRQAQNQQKAAELAKLKEDDAEITFKPKTNKYPLARETSGDKCLDLYARVKPGHIKEKTGRTTIEAEYEKEKEELSFAPKINQPGAHL